MENQPVKIVGQVGQREFGFGASDAASQRLQAIACRPVDRANEQTEPALLVAEDVFDGGAHQ